ncbi:hypothetical protein CYMTET_13376 [Cymbomonas tetramitiformis]|uniref:Ion transport domain-containing protein n=1 Tax=Cymbomonas tetramitiformis TaxID=36881 RepID=A0AAE0GIN0_9CHLO|nr:hypothetical protein CYMTET_13376 [Cymbomonas tetramitiformis]
MAALAVAARGYIYAQALLELFSTCLDKCRTQMNSLNVFRGSHLSKDRDGPASKASKIASSGQVVIQATINNRELLEEYLTTAAATTPTVMTPVSTRPKSSNSLNTRLRRTVATRYRLTKTWMKRSRKKWSSKKRIPLEGGCDVRLEHLCMGSAASIPQKDLADSGATEIAQLSATGETVTQSSPSPAFSSTTTNNFSMRADSDVSDCDSIESSVHVPAVVRYLNQFVIWPEGPKRICWDCMQAVIILYLAVMIPYRMGFNVTAVGAAYFWEFSCDIYFYLDIFVNFFTAFWRETDIDTIFVCDVRDIAINYISSWFFIDAIACLPLDLISKIINDKFVCSFYETGCGDDGSSSGAQALRLLKLFRMFRLLKLIHLMRVGRMLERWQDQLIFIDSLVTLMKTAVTMFLLSHWLGCMYATAYLFERNELGFDGSDREYTEYDSTTAYVGMLYWAVQTVTTVGYGNVSAYTVDEQLIAIAAMLIGGFVFSWLITSIFNSLNPDSTQRRLADRMSRVLEYLRGHQLPRDLATRILAYYRKQNNTTFDEKQLHRELPTVLRFELFSHLYYPFLQQVPALVGADSMFLNQVCAELGLVTFPGACAIYNFEDFCEELYIIKQGTVNIIKGGKFPFQR